MVLPSLLRPTYKSQKNLWPVNVQKNAEGLPNVIKNSGRRSQPKNLSDSSKANFLINVQLPSFDCKRDMS